MATAPDRRHLRSRLLAVGLTCAVAFAVLTATATSGVPNRVDIAVANRLVASSTYSRRFRLAELVSIGGSPVFVVVAALVLAAFTWTRRRDARLAVLCVGAPAVAGLLQIATKHLVDPRQPVWFDQWFPDKAFVFPSGHATGAASIATVVIVLALTSTSSRSSRQALVAVAVAYAVAVAVSRVVLDSHLATDVIGGLLLGTSVSALGGVVALRSDRTVEHHQTAQRVLLSRRRQPSDRPNQRRR